jgi:LmbE family N-acetylglucosaminyl deacetylase
MPTTALTQIYLSPHLDDAVFSCGGMIHRHIQGGGRVVVVTVCTGDPPPGPLSEYAESLHQRWQTNDHAPVAPAEMVRTRRNEDLDALAALGAQAVHLDVPDCIYRLNQASNWPLYTSDAAIFGPLNPSELTLVRRVATKLTNLLHGFGRHQLFVPLGIGNHVDHQLTRRAAEVAGGIYGYYEDYPYAANAFDGAGGPNIVSPSGRTLTRELVHLSEADLAGRVAAMARYLTQVSTFWPDPAALDTEVRQFTRRTGGEAPAERLWRVG